MISNANIIFIYEGNYQVIPYTSQELKSSILKKFADNFGSEVNDYNFYINNEKIVDDSSILEFINNNTQGAPIIIMVKRALKIIKCPVCVCNDCIMDIKDYKITFYGCEKGHRKEIVYDDYDMSQNIQLSNIKCDNPLCQKNQQICWGNFYKCLSCTIEANKVSKYFCYDCKDTHDKTHTKSVVKHNIKDFYCGKKNHFQPFSKYCNTCKEDICNKCTSHKGHKIVNYESLTPSLDDIKKNLNSFEEIIKKIRKIVDDIKVQVERAMQVIEKYYSISKNVIEKFVELKNQSLKNNKIIESVRNIKASNEIIMKQLNDIIGDKSLKNKFISLIDIYIKDRNNYTNLNKSSNNNNKYEQEDKLSMIYLNNPIQFINVNQKNK